MIWKYGAKYERNYVNGLKDGFGEYFFHNGNIYKG